jgi:hypothetical protein
MSFIAVSNLQMFDLIYNLYKQNIWFIEI